MELIKLQPCTKYIGPFAHFKNFPLSPNFNVDPGWKSVPIQTNSYSTTLKVGRGAFYWKKLECIPKLPKFSKVPNIMSEVVLNEKWERITFKRKIPSI